ncbi:hypothetical protein N1M2_130 [Klebsiella phage N1M2]|uniref:Uncharacterized protein n=1 Tax=Klebsiella phage N1M2 TaxID=2664939 RepID=A0A6B7ZEQ4_9CAUD|nr:hypothetical protein PQB72_gp130 [Klebsiella phage N1M2]QGH71993.1 hypothetical protein N1M2_130 [Klebsiella phage N1M2]
MSRTSDIRHYMVSQYPYMSYSQMLGQVKRIQDEFKVEINKGNEVGDSYTYGLIGDSYGRVMFKIKSNTEFSALDADANFTASNLNAFIIELEALVKLNKEGHFYDMIIPRTGDIMYAFGNNLEDIANLNAMLYSYLTRRHANRGRKGSDNDIKFKMKFTEGAIGEFWVRNIEFTDKMVSFKVGCEFEIIHNAFKSMYDFVIVTPALGQAVNPIKALKEKEVKPKKEKKAINTFDELVNDIANEPKLCISKFLAVKMLETGIRSLGKTEGLVNVGNVSHAGIQFELRKYGQEGPMMLYVEVDENLVFSASIISFKRISNDMDKSVTAKQITEQSIIRHDFMEWLEEYVGDDYIHNVCKWLAGKESGVAGAVNSEYQWDQYTYGDFSILIEVSPSGGFDVTVKCDDTTVASPFPFEMEHVVETLKPRGFLTRLLSVFSW